MVRAKFYVYSVTKHAPSNGRQAGTVRLHPVYSSDPNHENKRFWDATPSGSIEMQVNNMAALEQFEPGQEFYVDFTPAG